MKSSKFNNTKSFMDRILFDYNKTLCLLSAILFGSYIFCNKRLNMANAI